MRHSAWRICKHGAACPMDSENSPEKRCAPDERRAVALILVIDDEPDTLTALKILLSLLGFRVVAARNAREALEQIEVQRPDLIVTDNAMPSMSGLELCRVLRAREATRGIPIVMHTGMDLPDDGSRLYDRVMTKPIDIDAFMR